MWQLCISMKDLVSGVLKYQKKKCHEVERGWCASMKTFSTQGTKIQEKKKKKKMSRSKEGGVHQ